MKEPLAAMLTHIPGMLPVTAGHLAESAAAALEARAKAVEDKVDAAIADLERRLLARAEAALDGLGQSGPGLIAAFEARLAARVEVTVNRALRDILIGTVGPSTGPGTSPTQPSSGDGPSGAQPPSSGASA